MLIEQIHIECFGRKSDLHLGAFSDRLNVVYGPHGSGKTTTIQFLKWVLYGNSAKSIGGHDDPRHAPWVGEAASGDGIGISAGSIRFFENGHCRTLARQDDGTRYGRVALDGDSRFAQQSHHLVSLLGDIGARDFDALYAPNFESNDGLAELLGSSMARGADLTSSRLPSERAQELRLRIDHYRRDLDRLPWNSSDLGGLIERKRTIEQRIDSLEMDHRRRRADYDREFETLNRRIQELEVSIERLRSDWHSRDEEVARRRRELEDACRTADEARREYVNRRQSELTEIENHLSRARSMQSELQRRYDQLESQLRAADIRLDRSPKEVEESVCLVQSIAKQLDDLRSAESTLTSDTRQSEYRHAYRYRGSAQPVGASLDLLRSEVGQLCDTLRKERTGDRVRAMADELDQLRQTDTTMQRWIGGLNLQRDAVAREIEEAERHGVSLIVDEQADGWMRDDFDQTLHLLPPLRTGRLRAVQHSCDGYEPIEPESDQLLRQLIRHRDAAHSELQSTERELAQLMQRRRDLELALDRLTDRELEGARRELADVEALIRSAEERERIEREIATTEAELARLRDLVRNAPVTEHAARILERLTRGHYCGLRIDNSRDVSVEQSSGERVPFERLSRGIRDQVYLCFCLAIITSFRRRGVQIPLILHDPLTGIWSDYDQTLATVLSEFAAMGQQVIVFTQHTRLAQILQRLGANYLDLGRRIAPVAPVIPTPMPVSPIELPDERREKVRFRPRGGTTYRAPYETGLTDRGPESYPTAELSPPNSWETRPLQDDIDRNADFYRETRRATDSPGKWQADEDAVHRSWSTRSRDVPQPAPRRDYMGHENFGDQTFGYENVTFENDEPDPHGWDRHDGNFANLQHATQTIARSSPGSSGPLVDGIGSTGTLSLKTPIELTGTVDSDLSSRLRAIGVTTIDDFLRMSPLAIDAQLSTWGLASRPVRRWQSQLALRTHIADLSADDAGLLVACGAYSVAALGQMDLATLAARVERVLATKWDQGSATYVDRRRYYHRDRIAEWIQSARAAADRWSRRFTRNDATHDLASRNSRSSNSRSSNSQNRSEPSSRRGTRRDRSESTRHASSADRRRSKSRSPVRGERSARRPQQRARTERTEREPQWRFYLDRRSPIVDAPSIGPRTAQRLRKAGITSVDDLLRSDAAAVAKRIGHARISADDIRQWQQQAVLACRIPKMRGHDAQILVACGITDVDHLASMVPESLWGKIQPFLDTAECKRIVRNGKEPDLEEIRNWVTWSQHARELQSA